MSGEPRTSPTLVTVIVLLAGIYLVVLVGLTVIATRIDQERIVLCRIEAALSERPPSTPKSEECK